MRTETGTKDFFDIVTGVRMGCILSPFLFLLVVDFVMQKDTENSDNGVDWTNGGKLSDLDFTRYFLDCKRDKWPTTANIQSGKSSWNVRVKDQQ